MTGFFQDTAFARLVHLVSGGRYFASDDWPDHFALQRQLATHTQASSFTSRDDISVKTESTADQEKSGDEDNGVDKDIRIDPEAPNDPTILRFAEGDPQNPRNWTTARKFFATFQICFLTTSVYIGSAIYTAGIEDVVQTFHVSDTVALLGLTLFVVGYGLGPMLWAPMSEMPYIGRNPIYLGTLLVFVSLQPAVIYAKSYGMLLAFRFLTGFFGSPVLATGGASIMDMYAPNKRAYGISLWGLGAAIGPILGPIVGGFAVQHEGWTWAIWELMWLSGTALIMLFFCLPETSSANIIYRRTLRLRKVGGVAQANLTCEPEIEAEGMTGREIAMMILVRPFTLTFTEPIIFVLNLYIALLYALIYLWFESFPLVFIGIYHFNLSELGLAYLGILVGCVLTVPFLWWYLYTVTEPQFRNGELKPELRLPPACVGGFFIPVCMFMFGWSSRGDVHWIVPIIGTAFFGPGAYLLFNAVLNYLGDAYPKYAASVYAGNDLMRSGFGAAFPLFANALYHRLGLGWANTLLGFLAMAFIPVPFVLIKYGESLRRRSKNARHDL